MVFFKDRATRVADLGSRKKAKKNIERPWPLRHKTVYNILYKLQNKKGKILMRGEWTRKI